MTAIASPYRVAGESPLFARERALETELVKIRELLSAYANEEVRMERLVLVGQATKQELSSIRDTLSNLDASEAHLVRALEECRAEIAARGERKVIGGPRRAADDANVSLLSAIVLGLLTFGFLAAAVVVGHLRQVDTAAREPATASQAWGGPLAAGHSWLYVEGPDGAGFEVDGRPFRAPNRVVISALDAHEVRFEGGGAVYVRWIPCTTSLVSYDSARKEASVERFFNSATCF